MLSWKIWTESSSSWDALLSGFADRCVYQSFGWGEYKSNFGWTPVRLTAVESGKTVAMAQALVRRYPGRLALAWMPGGPVGSWQAFEEGFAVVLKAGLGVRHLYCRVNSLADKRDFPAPSDSRSGWCRPASPLLSGKSMEVDVVLPQKSWLASIDGKHRYYVKKSSSVSIAWVHGDNAALREDFARLTLQLSRAKNADLAETSVEMLDVLIKSLPGSVVILIGYLEQIPVTGSLSLVYGDKAIYATAATVGDGRKASAAYSMVAKLREILMDRGVVFFDFGGINPDSEGASGVDHFKKGFGCRQIDYVGERDWATSSVLRRAAGYLIKRRAGAMS